MEQNSTWHGNDEREMPFLINSKGSSSTYVSADVVHTMRILSFGNTGNNSTLSIWQMCALYFWWTKHPLKTKQNNDIPSCYQPTPTNSNTTIARVASKGDWLREKGDENNSLWGSPTPWRFFICSFLQAMVHFTSTSPAPAHCNLHQSYD